MARMPVGAQTKTAQTAIDNARSACVAANKLTAANQVPDLGPQPVPTVATLLPGGSAAINLKRRFMPGSKFFVDVDAVTFANPAASAGSFTATLSAPANHVPGYVHLYALSPVTCDFDIVPIAFIHSVFRFDVKSSNGWTVRVVPTEKAFKVDATSAELPYKVEFLRGAETTPFATLKGAMRYFVGRGLLNQLDVTLEEASSAQAEMEEVSKKMADMGKMTEAQQAALMQRFAKAMERVNAETMALARDPEAANKKVDDFGCVQLQANYPGQPGAITGSLSCGKNVGDNGSVPITGTIAVVK